ncbi:pimeloyl-ACP methyl ester carboxylesterase [Kribbella orskensis]|uniref:Pimeloyl-ACP methyl ester carboxylesterase n=1 Tax=Kribbella orskensis TaxID=2512216 RepID=A0ABY2BAU2_9ACTN|nr:MULTISPECIES: alpha/beta hydrolase [Kribbella]TCN31565.1 pimeloyl-ACP methyl ester carboxylesterase [Kribbella sp. VKM Ac-2500]TCO11910.1 pimeloyl-ACP methyl ester carboxylesterase [Kribbella orskensis]
MRTDILSVPGASLYYEVRGAGPVLLLVCGGVYDAAGYADLAQHFADRYTVVTYDRRGNSRSPLDGPVEPQSIEVHSDDAARVLAALGVTADAPADVFGNSSGAIIALDLVARHPELVRTLVAHEPPLFELLDDRDHWRTMIHSVEEAFQSAGPWAALEKLNAGFAADRADGDGPDSEAQQPPGPDAEADAETVARMQQNFAFFVGYEVPPFAAYQPDLAALAAAPTRVVPAVGEGSNGEPWVRAAGVLAERLGTEVAAFPGDHGGFGTEHQEFAARLDKLLRAAG